MTIETDRLVLREMCGDDSLVITAYNRKPGARQYLLAGQGEEGYTRRFVAGTILSAGQTPRTFYGLAICLKDEGSMIGLCTLTISKPHKGAASLGWELDRQYWGRGYATEAAKAMVRFGFETLGVEEVISDCFAANIASIRVMEKLGMRRQNGGLLFAWALAFRYHQMRPAARHRLTFEQWNSEQAKGAEK